MARKLALAVALLGAAATSGCVVIKQEQAVQQDGIGDTVRVTAKVCLNNSNPAPDPDCGAGLVGAGDFQGLLALRLPAGVEPPQTVATDLAGVTIEASPSYTSELERVAPAGEGLQWAGYITSVRTYTTPENAPAPTGEVTTVTAELALPAPPHAGTLQYQLVGGWREISDGTTPSPDAPVACNDTPGQMLAGTVCLDTAEADALTTFHTLALADVALAGPAAPVAIQAGRTAALTFPAVVTGSPAGVGLSATTTMAGATATPSVASLTASGAVTVSVVVPPGAPAGDHTVTLTAASGDATRTATGTLRVVAPAPPPPPPPPADITEPVLTAKAVKGQTPRSVARKGLRLRVALSEAATVAGGLERGKAVTRALPAGESALRLRLRKKARRAIRGDRKAQLALFLTATDAAGNAGALDKRVKVKRPRR